MRIHKLEIFGFKSFADRTALIFDEGISCVVGPNGCGKSNLVDAIKWCMGEGSAKSLRGSEMSDVIFAGSSTRAPVGFAEVTMTFDATEDQPFPGEFAPLEQLEVTRRLHRKGNAEYFLNRTRCRRRDIRELFLDTGIGNNMYSFIEQGSIGKIVHAAPSERRGLIDEAAGISKYKIRRAEAHSRMESTSVQLDRALDLEEEMGRRLKVLQKQALRATRFRHLRTQIRQRELLLAVAKFSDLSAMRRGTRAALVQIKNEHRQKERRVDGVKCELEAIDAEIVVQEGHVVHWHEELLVVDMESRERQGEVGFLTRRLTELEREGLEAMASITEVRRRHVEVEEKRAHQEQVNREHVHVLASHEDTLLEALIQEEEARAVHAEREEASRRAARAATEGERQLALAEAERVRLLERLEEQRVSQTRSSAELQALSAEKDTLASTLLESNAAVETARAAAEVLERRRLAGQSEVKQAVEERDQCAKARDLSVQDVEAARHQMQVTLTHQTKQQRTFQNQAIQRMKDWDSETERKKRALYRSSQEEKGTFEAGHREWSRQLGQRGRQWMDSARQYFGAIESGHLAEREREEARHRASSDEQMRRLAAAEEIKATEELQVIDSEAIVPVLSLQQEVVQLEERVASRGEELTTLKATCAEERARFQELQGEQRGLRASRLASRSQNKAMSKLWSSVPELRSLGECLADCQLDADLASLLRPWAHLPVFWTSRDLKRAADAVGAVGQAELFYLPLEEGGDWQGRLSVFLQAVQEQSRVVQSNREAIDRAEERLWVVSRRTLRMGPMGLCLVGAQKNVDLLDAQRREAALDRALRGLEDALKASETQLKQAEQVSLECRKALKQREAELKTARSRCHQRVSEARRRLEQRQREATRQLEAQLREERGRRQAAFEQRRREMTRRHVASQKEQANQVEEVIEWQRRQDADELAELVRRTDALVRELDKQRSVGRQEVEAESEAQRRAQVEVFEKRSMDLQKKVKSAQQVVEGMTERLAHFEQRLGSVREALRLIIKAQSALNVERKGEEVRSEGVRRAIRRVEQQMEGLVERVKRWTEEERVHLLAAQENGQRCDALRLRVAQLADETGALGERLTESKRRESDSLNRVAEAKVEKATSQERVVSGREQLVQLNDHLGELSAAAALGEQRVVKIEAQRQTKREELLQANEQIALLDVSYEDAHSKHEQASGLLQSVRERRVSKDGALSQARRALETVVHETRCLEERYQKIRTDLDVLKSRMDERYQVSLPGLLDEMDLKGVLIFVADTQVREDLTIGEVLVEGISDLEVRPGVLQDFERVENLVQEVDELRVQLQRVGEVNLAALDEFRELEMRYDDLKEQRFDLAESMSRIRSAIAKMNRLCRQRFRDAFDRVNRNFQALYPRLVGGGSARLALTDEEDLLETGVEIYVQPPGKRLQNLTLLSGGEKAMTAIALLLSLFEVKPSPFCLLDEVDAPLDEANGARFNDILREMSHVTQFLLITHNRKTMECGDTLYGVTMPTPGVSRVVSVRL